MRISVLCCVAAFIISSCVHQPVNTSQELELETKWLGNISTNVQGQTVYLPEYQLGIECSTPECEEGALVWRKNTDDTGN